MKVTITNWRELWKWYSDRYDRTLARAEASELDNCEYERLLYLAIDLRFVRETLRGTACLNDIHRAISCLHEGEILYQRRNRKDSVICRRAARLLERTLADSKLGK